MGKKVQWSFSFLVLRVSSLHSILAYIWTHSEESMSKTSLLQSLASQLMKSDDAFVRCRLHVIVPSRLIELATGSCVYIVLLARTFLWFYPWVCCIYAFVVCFTIHWIPRILSLESHFKYVMLIQSNRKTINKSLQTAIPCKVNRASSLKVSSCLFTVIVHVPKRYVVEHLSACDQRIAYHSSQLHRT